MCSIFFTPPILHRQRAKCLKSCFSSTFCTRIPNGMAYCVYTERFKKWTVCCCKLCNHNEYCLTTIAFLVVRRAGLLWSQQDFEWRWSVPLFKCLTVLEFSFILFYLCLLIAFFNFIMNYVPIVTFWIFTYHTIWILSIMFCFIWSYWIIYFLACLEVSWGVVS